MSSTGGTPKRQRQSIGTSEELDINPFATKLREIQLLYDIAQRAIDAHQWNDVHMPLNTDVWAMILDNGFLSHKDLLQFRLVCKNWSVLGARLIETVYFDIRKPPPYCTDVTGQVGQRLIGAFADAGLFVRMHNFFIAFDSPGLGHGHVRLMAPLLARVTDLSLASAYSPLLYSLDLVRLLKATPLLRVARISANRINTPDSESTGFVPPPLEELAIDGHTAAFISSGDTQQHFSLASLLLLPTLRKLCIVTHSKTSYPFVVSNSIVSLLLRNTVATFGAENKPHPVLDTIVLVYSDPLCLQGYFRAHCRRFYLRRLVVHTTEYHTAFDGTTHLTFVRMLNEMNIRCLDLRLKGTDNIRERILSWTRWLETKLSTTTTGWVLRYDCDDSMATVSSVEMTEFANEL